MARLNGDLMENRNFKDVERSKKFSRKLQEAPREPSERCRSSSIMAARSMHPYHFSLILGICSWRSFCFLSLTVNKYYQPFQTFSFLFLFFLYTGRVCQLCQFELYTRVIRVINHLQCWVKYYFIILLINNIY